jgi:hypothetical protein
MRSLAAIEVLSTRHLMTSTFALLTLTSGLMLFVVTEGVVSLEKLASIVDVVFKVAAGIIGTAWVLNRHFMSRVDGLQIRIDADVNSVPAGQFKETPDLGLLIARLDVVNTGKTLLAHMEQFLVLTEVYPSEEGVKERTLLRWPAQGTHPVGPIEPGSWSATNFAHPISSSTAAVCLYTELHVAGKPAWTWHKTFKLEHFLKSSM